MMTKSIYIPLIIMILSILAVIGAYLAWGNKGFIPEWRAFFILAIPLNFVSSITGWYFSSKKKSVNSNTASHTYINPSLLALTLLAVVFVLLT